MKKNQKNKKMNKNNCYTQVLPAFLVASKNYVTDVP